jgi:hypothetical protein
MERKSWGFSLFCDDLRAEVGGKVSLMGIYGNDMVFANDAPFTLPKFCIFVKYFEERYAFNDDILIRVYFPGDQRAAPSAAFPFARSLLATAEPPFELEEDQEQLVTLTLPLLFSPLTVNKEGFLKVRAICGGVVTNLGSLMIRKARPNEQAPGPSDAKGAPAV